MGDNHASELAGGAARWCATRKAYMMAITSDQVLVDMSTGTDGFWMFDRVHAPRPLTPLSRDLLLPAFGDGMTAAMRELEYPNTFVMRAINHFAYIGIIP